MIKSTYYKNKRNMYIKQYNNLSKIQVGGDLKNYNDELKVYVSPSDIQGVGLRALRDIKKGEQVMSYSNNTPLKKFNDLKEYEKKYLDGLNGYNEYIPEDSRSKFHVVNFLNHSLTPNVKFENTFNINGNYIATKDIKKGEEISINLKQDNYNLISYNKIQSGQLHVGN